MEKEEEITRQEGFKKQSHSFCKIEKMSQEFKLKFCLMKKKQVYLKTL
jgi:hypothetical protein